MSPSAELVFDASLTLGDFSVRSSFTVGRGELVAIAGDIGAGKSSILRLIAGQHRVTSGQIQFDGEYWDCTESGAFVPPEKRPIAFVPQDFRSVFDPAETALDAISRLRPVDEARALLHTLTLGDHIIDRPVATLSNGEAQRAALAYALAHRPDVLLLDEPFVALDQFTSEVVHAWLDGWLAESGVPTIIVTHDEADHDHFVDKVIEVQ